MEIKVVENVLKYNKEQADINRKLFQQNHILVLNLLSSPGAGKTSFIIETLKRYDNPAKVAVIEGDISSTCDSEKIKGYTDNVVQINTGGTCHLNASMIEKALEKLNLSGLDIIFVENVGNLICPVGFDLGENYKILISSVSEGDDKALKYPPIFMKSNLIILNKIDLLENSNFDVNFFNEKAKELNPDIEILQISCKTGSGMLGWLNWLKDKINNLISISLDK